MRVQLCESFTDLERADLIDHGIRLLGVDIENVLTDYHVPELLPGVSEKFEELQTGVDGLKLVLITNNTDSLFLDEVGGLLDSPKILSPSGGYKKKPDPEMFIKAVRDANVKPLEAAHVDDQFKSYLGASKAGYKRLIWTKPQGEHQHKGVKAFRPVEFGVIRPLIAARNIATGWKN